MTNLLKFSPGNAKLKNIPSVSLLSGYSCPFAEKCLSKADLKTRHIIDGPKMEFRCFSATQENIFTKTFEQRKHNFDLLRKLRTAQEMADLIQLSLPVKRKNEKAVRLHVSGDFFSKIYFQAFVIVAKNNPDRIFYAYTKSLQYWVDMLGQIPDNFRLTASYGGKLDHLIEEYNLKSVKVVYSVEEAEQLGLEIDHDDSHAYLNNNQSFALIIHGTQKAGSAASKANQALKNKGFMGYNRKKGGYVKTVKAGKKSLAKLTKIAA